MIPPAPSFEHIVAMSDGVGTFEHAKFATPRIGHGYCTDDMARVLVAACRQAPCTPATVDLARLAYRFLADAQGVDGKVRNRRATGGRWTDRRGVEDCWGRAMWAFGTAMHRAPLDWMRQGGASAFQRGLEQRSPAPRAMAFAALGAAEVLAVRPANIGARRLLVDAVAAIGRPGDRAAWVWPEARLSYANAALAEALIAAGDALGRADVLADGLAALRWLLARETVDGHLSLTGVGGAGPDDRSPMFDQQPIEAAAMADACARAFALTGENVWRDGLTLSVDWFLGANDSGVVVFDADHGACFDGLQADGVNLNEGTESTLALITVLQHARTAASAA
jgi:hypothetical protein